MIVPKYEPNTNIRTMNRLFNSSFDCSIARLFLIRLLAVYLSTAYCLLPTLHCIAQQKSEVIHYARTIVDTLASPSMHGRGYVNKGDSIAADFIKKEFEKIGLKPIGKEFYQRFNLSVNTLIDSLQIIAGDKLLIPGKDYIVLSSSYSCDNTYEVVRYDKNTTGSKRKLRRYYKNLQGGYKGKVLIIDKGSIINTRSFIKNLQRFSEYDLSSPVAIFSVVDKLTADVSQNIFYPNLIDVLSNTIPPNTTTIKIYYRNYWHPNYQSKNIIGYIEGNQQPDSFIVFTAHYDHLGQMGKDVYFPGANDNASGVAMLLSLAKYYSQLSLLPSGGAGGGLKYSVAFMAFGAEEVGLLGSKQYVENPLFPLKKIKFLVNFDIVGTGDEGIKVVNATEHKKEFDELVKINSEKNLLPSVQPRGKAAISDHHFFEEAEVKTFYIYTLGGIKAYHDIYDRPETLPLTEFEDLYKLMIEFTEYLQK